MLTVFHAYLVYEFTHKWSTKAALPRIFGLHLRIKGLRMACNMFILNGMRTPLYACMYYLYIDNL